MMVAEPVRQSIIETRTDYCARITSLAIVKSRKSTADSVLIRFEQDLLLYLRVGSLCLS